MGHFNLLFISLTLLLILSAAFSAEDYQQAGLEEHNKYRADHGVDALTLNENLNELAVKCANYYAGKGRIDHKCPDKNKKKHGENLYLANGARAGGDPTPHTKTAIKLWYEEIGDYDWENPDCTKGIGGKPVGHFTQLVWKASKELGVGYVEKDSTTIVVALYSPPGNFLREEKENVLPSASVSREGREGESKGVAPNQAPQWILVFPAATFIALTWKELYN